jgi:hypothetical protein
MCGLDRPAFAHFTNYLLAVVAGGDGDWPHAPAPLYRPLKMPRERSRAERRPGRTGMTISQSLVVIPLYLWGHPKPTGTDVKDNLVTERHSRVTQNRLSIRSRPAHVADHVGPACEIFDPT